MSTAPHSNTFARRLREHRGLLAINLLCLAALLPFIAKPIHLDDPMYLWTVRQVRQHPFDPYGLEVNWQGFGEPMARVMKNPPGVSYYLAAASVVFGWSEMAMHVAMLLPALGLASGTYLLGKRWCERPLLAALATMLAPGVFVSATTIMVDVPMLCLYVWAIYLWVVGIDQRRTQLLFAAAVLATASALCKYFGVSLIPLFAVYAILRTRKLAAWSLILLIPVGTLALYQAWTGSLYGQGMLLEAAGFSTSVRWSGGAAAWVPKMLTALAFVGGCGATIALVILFGADRRRLLACASAIVAMLVLIIVLKPFRVLAANPGFIPQLALMSAAGAVLLVESLARWRQTRRDPVATTLLLWILGTLAFATLLNWSTNARVIMPMIPAAAILAMRGPRAPLARAARIVPSTIGIVVGGAIAISAACADQSLARSARDAADLLATRVANPTRAVWFLGHWGFQWYCELHDFQPIDVNGSTLRADDLILIPSNNSQVYALPAAAPRQTDAIEVAVLPWISTMNERMGAGFYSDVWGPMPFAFGPVPTEKYRVMKVTQPVTLSSR